MAEKITPQVEQFVLPFALISENRKEAFTADMAVAAVFSLAELERAKGGGLVLKQPEEKIAFIAKMGYPLWLIPWSGLNLLFDGLDLTTHTLSYRMISDAKAFMTNLKRSSKTKETHLTFLSDNINYFQTPASEKVVAVKGLVRDPDLLNELTLYLMEAEPAPVEPTDMAMLSPAVDESTILSITQELGNLNFSFKEEVDTLCKSMKLLSSSTQNFVKELHNKIRAVKEEFADKIKDQEEITTSKVNRINEEYDAQMTQLTKNFEKQLLPLQKEKVKLEKNKEETLGKIERYKLEAKTHADNQDDAGERRWKEKVSENKKELSQIEDEIKETEKKIKEMKERKSLDSFELRSDQEAKVKEAKKDLLELEASRDAKIQVHKQDIEKLEKLTASITEQIDSVAKLREANITALEKLGIKRESKENMLFYVPFYLTCYQNESKKRYVVLPPSTVETISLSTRLKGALGKARVKGLFVPRFRGISSLLYEVTTQSEQNAVFAREINENGDRTDILKARSTREQIKNGLTKLKNEGWLSEKEYESFSQKFV